MRIYHTTPPRLLPPDPTPPPNFNPLSPALGPQAAAKPSPPEGTPGHEDDDDVMHTPRKQQAPSYEVSASSALRTPVRIEATPRCGPRMCSPPSHCTPVCDDAALSPPSKTPTPITTPMRMSAMATPPQQKSRRRDGLSPSRVLDAAGITSNPRASILAYTADALVVALGKKLYMWSPAIARCIYDSPDEIVCVCASQQRAACGVDAGRVHYFNLDMPPQQQHMQIKAHEQCVTALAIHGAHLYSGCAQGRLYVHDVHSGAVVWCSSLPSAICAVSVSADGSHVAVGTADGLLLFHSANVAEPKTVCTSQCPVRVVAWSPSTKSCATLAYVGGANNHTLHLYSNGIGEKACRDVGAEVCAAVWSASTSEIVLCHGDLPPVTSPSAGIPALALSNMARTIGIYEVRNDNRVKVQAILRGHLDTPCHCALSPDGTTVATAAAGRCASIRFWSVFPPKAPNPPDLLTTLEFGCEELR